MPCSPRSGTFADIHHRNKAVSDGSVSFSLDHHVKARVTKLAYGKNTSILYNPRDPDHVSRQLKVFRDNDGRRFLPSLFSLLLAKVRYVDTFMGGTDLF